MSKSRFVEILDAIVDALNEDRPTGVPEVTKRRVIPGEKIESDRMAVLLGDETVDEPIQRSTLDPTARRKLTFAVECVGVTNDVEQLDECVEPMVEWAVEILGRSNLDKLVHYVRETGTSRAPEMSGDVFVMKAIVFFEVSYQTRRNDLRQP